MKFFDQAINNILPYDGIVEYHGRILSVENSDFYFDAFLKNISWKNDEVVIFGRHIITKRKVAWYGDENFQYTYSNRTRVALPWTSELLDLKQQVEKLSGVKFNSCLLNLYHDGEEGMAWHSDDENCLAQNSPIASFSFGSERKFCFRHKKTKETISMILAHGSLLIMKDVTQMHWLHALPKSKKIKHPRVNLTFRTMVN